LHVVNGLVRGYSVSSSLGIPGWCLRTILRGIEYLDP